MQKSKEEVLYKSSSMNTGIQVGIISIISLIVIFLLVWNTSGLNFVLKKSTDEYVKDISYQLTNDISSRILTYETVLEQIASAVPRMETDRKSDILQESAERLGFDALIVVDTQGNTVPVEYSEFNLQDLSGVKEAFKGETSVMYIEDQSLLFSAPVYSGTELEGVLLGVRKKENVQKLIQPKGLGGKGLTCIIDNTGEVIISPTDLKPFMQLEDIFKKGTDKKTINDIEEMKNNMVQGNSGVFRFVSVTNEPVTMAYHEMEVNGWILLTLVPSDLISEEANKYILNTFIIVGAVTLFFVLFVIIILYFAKKNRKKLEKLAFSDFLTGGMNNTAFQMECRKMVENSQPDTYTLVFLNIKNFKFINEHFGQTAGDNTLKYIYNVLKIHMNTDEIVSRISADRFFILIKENTHENVQRRIDEIIEDINSFPGSRDIEQYIILKQGAYIIENSDMDVAVMQERARIACNMQKEPDKCEFYSSEFSDIIKREQEINALFEKSLENHDFHVFLQPKIRLKDGKIGGAEALVRWFHPQMGTVFPSEFIPLFEKSGNICRLDLYVFEEVCRLIKNRIENNKEIFPVSVNLSRVHFKNLNFLPDFSEIKEKYNIPDNLIELEVTESVFFYQQQITLVKGAIEKMHKAGFLCSLDDFGVGFSALALLKEFDIDTIKLDKQFFNDISSRKTQCIIEGFIAMGNKLGINVVAEGIETTEQLEYLKSINCDMVQGYIFSKPLSVSDFENWYNEKNFGKTGV